MPLFLHHRSPFVEIALKVGLKKYRQNLENLYWKVNMYGGKGLSFFQDDAREKRLLRGCESAVY
jgi:hypothetical protein